MYHKDTPTQTKRKRRDAQNQNGQSPPVSKLIINSGGLYIRLCCYIVKPSTVIHRCFHWKELRHISSSCPNAVRCASYGLNHNDKDYLNSPNCYNSHSQNEMTGSSYNTDHCYSDFSCPWFVLAYKTEITFFNREFSVTVSNTSPEYFCHPALIHDYFSPWHTFNSQHTSWHVPW